MQAFAFFPENREWQLQVPEVRDSCVSRLNMEKGRVFYCNCVLDNEGTPHERPAERSGQANIGVRWEFDTTMYNKGYIILFCLRCGKEQGNARMLDARGKLYDED